MVNYLILITMIFCHIVDDYYLQGILASMKQKQWWKDNAPDDFYKDDYIMALLMHGFSWTFMVMIIPTIYCFINEFKSMYIIFVLFGVNWMVHCIVDDLKANKKILNLIQDQTIHLVQVICIWRILIL